MGSPLLRTLLYLLSLSLLCAGGLYPPAHASVLQGNWTSLFWNREVPSLQGSEARWQVYESLQLQAEAGDLSVYVHPRVSKLEDWEARLFQGYVEWRPAKLRVRLGRQFLPNDVGFWQMDGARIGWRHAWLNADLYGGSAVTPWGENRSGVTGFDIRLRRAPFASARGNMVAIYDEDTLERLIVGAQLGTLGGSLLGVHRSAQMPVQLFGRANVDVLSQTLVSGYGRASVGVPLINLYGEYQKETPLFPEESIFTVFAVEPWEQVAVGLQLKPFDALTLEGRYARQFYDAGPLERYRAGVRLGPFASHLERIEDEHVEYWRTHSWLRLTYGRWMVRLSHYYNDYRQSPLHSFETAYSYQLQLRYLLARRLELMARVEDNVNSDFEYNVRALGSIRWRFRMGRRMSGSGNE